MKITLREKILIPVMATIALGMLAGFAYSYMATIRAIREEVSRAMVREVRLTAGLMDQWLHERHTDLFTLSGQPVLIEALTETGYYGRSAIKGADALLANLETGYPYYNFLYLVNPDGDLVSTSHISTGKRYNVSDRQYFQASINGKEWVSRIVNSRESGKKVFVVSVPLKAGDKIVGILAGAVNVSAFKSFFIHNFELGREGFAYVTENTGRVMAISKDKKDFSNIAAFDFGKVILSSDKGIHTYRHGNQNLLSAYHKLAYKDWTFVLSQSLDEAYKPVRKAGWTILVAAIFLLSLVSLVVIGIFRKMIYQRFDRMLEAIGMVEKGNLKIRIKGGDQHDEIGELSKAFNAMTARLDKTLSDLQLEIRMRKLTEQDLEHHRDNLEKLVTDRTAELVDLQHYLSDIINSMPSIIVGVDNEIRVSQWNLKAEQTINIPQGKALGEDLATLFPHLETHREKIRHAIRHKMVQQIPKVARDLGDLGDRRCYEEITVYPLMSRGMEGAVIRIDDVTQRVKLEELMIQSEKMMSVGGLAAGMAHEINNPLAGIIQNIQVLKNRLSTDLPKNRQVADKLGVDLALISRYMEERGMHTIMDNIMYGGSRAAKIVSNMLSFSRKGTDGSNLVDLTDLMDQTIDLAENDYDLQKGFDFKEIRVDRRYGAKGLHIRCHPSMLQQVFFNILKNGAQAMASAYTTDKTREPAFTISIEKDKDLARIEIGDNGPGMDKETRKRIFEPFFTTKEVGVGTGLGMSVSYFIIVENHGGTIEVRSDTGKGTTFTVCLPINGK
ncbi:MAG: HAMP domain-containing protein [Desulfobacteraceae bacterium]|nr:HAMP domain-containing protein [Desulfobacteraceae bacterium]